MARSITLQIFSACVSEREPPKTVKSWAKTNYVSPVDQAKTCDHAVTWVLLLFQSKVFGTMNDQLVELFKRTFIQKKFNSLSRSHLS